jgi:hypothetical protein
MRIVVLFSHGSIMVISVGYGPLAISSRRLVMMLMLSRAIFVTRVLFGGEAGVLSVSHPVLANPRN